MTRDEAIDELKRDIHNAKVSHHLSEHYEMAIEALEQEPCEDCVSRKAVRDTIFAKCSVENLDIDFAKVLMLQRAIKAIPSVTPQEQEPKQGRWIEEFNDIEGEVRFTCSCCGKYQLFGTDYCYHCGSKNE